jgi:hypothetical protein
VKERLCKAKEACDLCNLDVSIEDFGCGGDAGDSGGGD